MQAPVIKSSSVVPSGPLQAQTLARATAGRRPPVMWIGAGLVALAGVAAAAFYAGRGVERQQAVQAAPAAAVQEDVAKPSRMSPAQSAGPARDAEAVGCVQCGVVESVQAVQRKGEGSGVGAVAGGVLGGALGSQVGRGDGRTAMTVLGAIGGGLAGNEVEKRVKATTTYRIRVRTEGGELRTFEHSSAPAVGQRVRIDGRQLLPMS